MRCKNDSGVCFRWLASFMARKYKWINYIKDGFGFQYDKMVSEIFT